MRQTCRQQEEDLAKLKSELVANQQKQQQHASLTEQREQLMLAEINEECKRVAAILGVSPRIIIPGYFCKLQMNYKLNCDTRTKNVLLPRIHLPNTNCSL